MNSSPIKAWCVFGVLFLVAFAVAPCAAQRMVRGMFGDRVLGRPLAPRSAMTFRSAVRRGPSGDFRGLTGEGRFGGYYRPMPQEQWQASIPARRPAPPSVVPWPTRPADVWMRTRPRPAPTTVRPPARPVRPPDVWFRSRPPRAR